MILLESLRNEVVEAGNKLVKFGLVKGRAGNISARDTAGGLFAISPSRMDYDKIKPADVVLMDSNGVVVDGSRPPSSEYRLHHAIYASRSDVAGIVHHHSPFAIAYTLAGKDIDLSVFAESLLDQKVIPILPKTKPGTQELAAQVAAFFLDQENEACLLEGHGLIVVGATLSQAFARACYIDEAAQAFIYAWVLH